MLFEKSCVSQTIASKIDLSPCGWNIHIVSQTTLADFIKVHVKLLFNLSFNV